MSQVGSFGVNYTRTFTTDEYPHLPAKVRDVGSSPVGEFVFVQADGAIDQYGWVKVDYDGQAVMVNQTNDGTNTLAIGVAQVAFADNEYGWVWVGGLNGGGTGSGIKGKVAAGYVAKNNLYTTANAGIADDDSSGAAVKIAYVVGVAGTTPAAAVELASVGHAKIN